MFQTEGKILSASPRDPRNPKSRGVWAGFILAEFDDAIDRIEALISKLRFILSPDMLRILGYRLIQTADEIEPAPGLRGSVYGWEPVRLAVRNLDEYRTVRLITDLDATTYTVRDVIEELQRQRIENRSGRLDWRADRVHAVLDRERSRRSLTIGIDAPGSPLVKLASNVSNIPPKTSAE